MGDVPAVPAARGGPWAWITDSLALVVAGSAIAWALLGIEALRHRAFVLLASLLLVLLADRPKRGGSRARSVLHAALVMGAVASLAWPLADRGLVYRAAMPSAADIVLGSVAVVVVLEATRRCAGPALPLTALVFLAYAWLGPLLDLVSLGTFAHRGYDLPRLVGTLYMTLEGIFGVPLDVAATYIVLFSLFGAVLEASGAGEFYVAFSQAAFSRSPSPAGAARAVTGAGFLLGSVSGSGVATTVTLGSITWPLLRRSGYSAEAASGLLAAAGIGALLSPPTLGAAAFLIAEFLEIPYLAVLKMAVLPTLLYYAGALLTAECDARLLGTRAVPPGDERCLARLTLEGGHHFLPLLAAVALLVAGLSAFRAVLWATALAVLVSARDPSRALGPRRLLAAFTAAGRASAPFAVVTATAGIVVGVVALTGLGLRLGGILVALAGGHALPTVVLGAVAVTVLGLAVPVTASYIISAVMIVPALTQVGVDPMAAHMFVFYYAVLSEVSPPTALAPLAAAALTGASPAGATLAALRYTLPVFLVPIAFTVGPWGPALLLRGTVLATFAATAVALCGIAALALGTVGHGRGPLGRVARGAAVAGGVLLFLPFPAGQVAGGILAGYAVLADALGPGPRRDPR